jgi:hypothetical protein
MNLSPDDKLAQRLRVVVASWAMLQGPAGIVIVWIAAAVWIMLTSSVSVRRSIIPSAPTHRMRARSAPI